MTLALAGVKSNPSRSYPTSAATLSASRPALINKFTDGSRLTAREKVTRLPSKRGKKASSRPVQFKNRARTIV